MKLFNLFNRKAINSQEIPVTQWLNDIFGYMGSGFVPSDVNKEKLITNGYQSNHPVYSVISRISQMCANVPIVAYDKIKNELVEVENDEILNLLKNPNSYQDEYELRIALHSFLLMLGDTYVYAPTIENGNNTGKVIKEIGLHILPAHEIEIELSNNIIQPIIGYKNTGSAQAYKAQDVWHLSYFNPDFNIGQNFYGQSPLQAAYNLMTGQNESDYLKNQSFRNGLPPGILSKLDEQGSVTKEEIYALERAWDNKFGKNARAAKPLMSKGQLQWTQIGFSNFRDLLITDIDKYFLRALCNVLQVPSQIFNDGDNQTYNNIELAMKQVYTNRIMPDLHHFTSKLTRVAQTQYKLPNRVYKADYSNIPELQNDREKLARIYKIGVQLGAYTLNEFRTKLGDEVLPDANLDKNYINSGQVPLSDLDVDMFQNME